MINRCHVCDRVNTAFNASAQELHPLPIQGIFDRWGSDHAGPFNPVSELGSKNVMVMIEHFTINPNVTPKPVKSAAITAQVFLGGFCADMVVVQK